MDIELIRRTGSELFVRFGDEQAAARMEAALGAMFPPDEQPVPAEPEAAAPESSRPVRYRIKSEWHDGFVLEVFVTNEGQDAARLQLPLRMEATIEDVWGGTFKQVGSNTLISSDKPIESGETWDFTLKARGIDHDFTVSPPIQAEEDVEPVIPPEVERETAAPTSAPQAVGTPRTLVYAPTLDITKDAKKNILDNLGGVYEGGWEWENIEVVDDPDGPCLRTHMGQGLYVGDKGKRRGGGFDTRTLKATHAVLEYDLRFKPGFDPVKGGKLPGLMAGDSPSGHKEALNGMTARMMWRRNAEGELYLYFPDMKVSHGDSIGRGNFHFDTSGGWHTIRQEVRLNDVGRANGFIKVWYDGELVIEATDLRLRTKDSVLLEGIMHTIFFGGGDRSWAATRDEWIDTRNFKIYEL